MEQMLRQAKDLQSKLAEAATKTQEQAKPYIDEAIATSKKMGDHLADRMRDSAVLTNEQTQQALETMRGALKDAQPHLESFVEIARKAASDVLAQFETKKPPQ